MGVDEPADRLGDIDEAIVRRELSAAVAGVSPASRAVLSLHYLEGLSLPEAATILGLPVGTAKSRLSAGIAQLRRRFGSSRRGP